MIIEFMNWKINICFTWMDLCIHIYVTMNFFMYLIINIRNFCVIFKFNSIETSSSITDNK